MSSVEGVAVTLTPREQRRVEREERKRRRNGQESSTKQPTSEKKKEKTPGKDLEKKNKTASNGGASVHKKPPSGAKRVNSYDKVNIIEKTPKFETTEKENKGKKQNEVTKPEAKTARQKLGSKFMDNLSKFENRNQDNEDNKKTPFVRSYSSVNQSSANDSSAFRRSHRPSRSTPAVNDPSILMRRSLRRERVLDSIAKLEKQSTLKEKPASPGRPRSDENKEKVLSRRSSASSSKTSLSDSGSSTTSTKGLSRAQQALERHKNRIRSTSQTSGGGVTPSPTKPSSPACKSRSFSNDFNRKTPNKSKSKELQRTPSVDDQSPSRKVSVTKSPLDGDKLEVTMVTEVMTPAEGKMNVVVKEHVLSEEEAELLLSPQDGTEDLPESEYQPGDPRPVSVEDVVAIFNLEDGPPPSPEPIVTPVTKTRRKLPEIPADQTTSATKEGRSRRKKSKKHSTGGSGEPHSFEEQSVVVIETSPTFKQFNDIFQVSSPKSEKTFHNFNQNSSNIEPLKHDQKSLELDQSPPTEKSLKQDQKLMKQNLKSQEHNSISPVQKSSKHDQKLLKHDQIIQNNDQNTISLCMNEQIKPKVAAEVHVASDNQPITEGKDTEGDKKYDPEDAIQVLRRLSEEIHSQPIKTSERSSVSGSKVEPLIEEENQDLTNNKKRNSRKKKKSGNNAGDRPTSLHIQEVLYIADDDKSPLRRTVSETTKTSTQEVAIALPSPEAKQRKSSRRSKQSSSSSSPEKLSSPPRSPTKTRSSRTPQSPVKDYVSFSETPVSLKEAPTITPVVSETSTLVSPNKTPTTTPLSPKKTPTTTPLSPKNTPTTTPLSPPKKTPTTTAISPVKSLPSPVKTQSSVTPTSPVKSVKTKSPDKTAESPSKSRKKSSEKTADSFFVFPDQSTETKASSKSPESATSPVRSLSPTKSNDMDFRKKVLTRRQDSWLDDSDSDDSAYILSDASSDASDIDLDWLGVDSDASTQGKKKQKSKPRSDSVGVQRTASKAKDMLKLWEKKAAAEPKLKTVTSPVKQPKKLSSTMAAWEQKAKENGLSDASDTNGHGKSEKSASPLTPRSQRSSVTSSPKRESIRSTSGSDLKLEEEPKEIQEIFDEKVSGKIQGAKALFENLGQSPVRSPSFVRPTRKRVEEKVEAKPRVKRESVENSPIVSRKSSFTDNHATTDSSRKSSISLSSDSSDDEASDESPSVDNMRAMFENQAKSKQNVRKHRSLAEMVADDDNCDITDVRSVKAMWESMDNRRSSDQDEEPKRKPKKQSNIQKRAAAKKKKGRRSMTQPVTSDDVIKAKDMMNGNTKPNSEGEEEEVLNFVDRLKFFNQLSKNTSSPKSKVRRRSDTQPVKSSQISKATELLTANQQKNEKSTEIKSLKKVSPNHSPLKSPTKTSRSPITKSTPTPILSPKSPTIVPSIQRLTRKFSISSSSDNESLLSSSSTSTDDCEPGKKKLYLSEESTASSVDMSVDVAEIKSTGSIHERMKRLQQNTTEEKWRKQSRNSEIKSSVSERLNKLKTNDEKWKKNPAAADFAARAEKLSERIAKMKEDSMTWKDKSGKQNDATQFTVQAKLAKREGIKAVAVLPSPLIKRRVLPMIVPSHVSAVTETDAKSNDDSTSMNQLSFVEKLANKGLEENVLKRTEVLTTEVPEFDEKEFEKFFVSTPEMNGDAEHEIDDLPQLEGASTLSDIGRLKTNVQQKNKRKSSARNPLKALAKRADLKQSYDTERLNIARLEQQRIAQRGYGANFTSAALAGLAAKADLKNVNLRSAKNTPMPSSDDLKPFKDVMLLRAKGRRQVQTRLVEPRPSSLCSDDAYLLVTPTKLFGWFGEFCNVIERAKINEIADYIVIKGDLGCKVSALKTIEEDHNPKHCKEFWDFLGGVGEWQKSPSPGADEQYEVDVGTTIKTYKMIDSKLVPYEDAWGKFPKMEMLGSSDTFVFDFGAEMYIWQGKEVSFSDRRLAVRLARVIWEQDYDYTEQGLCPFHGLELKGKREDWALFARVNENLETSLFQEKFENWSNIHREIGAEEAVLRESNRGKEVVEKKTKSSIASDMQGCDPKEMRDGKTEHVPLIIEGCDVSQGAGDIVDEDGRILEIVTKQVETFHVTESNVEPFNDSVLHRSNSYVVKWKYSISSTGRFENSKESKSSSPDTSSNGRERVAYFSWVGSDAAVGDKGASAIIASNMDTDDGPILNIEEATAPPVFNKCFHGNLVIMDGKRGVKRGSFTWRLYEVRGHCEDSVSLIEVNCECRSLRSCSSFVTLLPRDATAIVWHGCRSPKNIREAAEAAINKMSERMPGTIPFRRNPTCLEISICEEGSETDAFWEAVGVKRRTRYECLLDVSTETRITRAWNFTIDKETFIAKQLQSMEDDSLFPIVKEQLFELETPCLVLIDSTHGTFLWQNCDSKSLNASAKRRWDVIRRLAIETTIKYCEEYEREEAVLIEAGLEPQSLTNAFPSWKTKEKSVLDKLITSKPQPVSKVLMTLSRLTYSIEELRGPDLPDGVDASHLESYLTNTDFEKLFKMTKKEFYELPVWKQMKIRKEKNFF
uniref:supervillin-like isoform X1 n=1 Tax=Styela clava TaxID=7725 RepID=UPI001939B634|nr:supervillin-like isoform X1 [Styela clava]